MLLVVVSSIAIVMLLAGAAGALAVRSRRRSRRIGLADDPQSTGLPSATPSDTPQIDSLRGAEEGVIHTGRIASSPPAVLPDMEPSELPREDQKPVEVVDTQADATLELVRLRQRRSEARWRKLQERDEIWYEDADDLERGKQLGVGGQGAVYELVLNSNQVAKYWAVPLDRGSRELEELVHMREEVNAAISAHPIHLCWPDSPIRNKGMLVGYTMQMIAAQFYFEMTIGPVTRTRLREMQYAIPRSTGAKPYPFKVDDCDRLELVYLVAVFLEGMHRNDIVYGDISWKNFTFSLDPVELCVLDFDSSRIQGSLPFTRGLPLDSTDWDDPQWRGSVVARTDIDRYKFALFAYRMLVEKNFDAEIDSARVSDWSSDSGSKLLSDLWSRAQGAAGTRPQISEWKKALEQLRASGGVSKLAGGA